MADGTTPMLGPTVGKAEAMGDMLRARGARRIGIGQQTNGRFLVCFTHGGLSQLWVVRRDVRLWNLARDMDRELGPTT